MKLAVGKVLEQTSDNPLTTLRSDLDEPAIDGSDILGSSECALGPS